MHLHRHLAQIELGRDLFVRTTGHDEREHFPLAHRQRGEARLQFGDGAVLLAPNAVALDCDLDRVEQLLLTQGLRQEFDGAQLHCPHGHGNVAVPADEYDRKPHARLGYPALELESARPWQPDVEHDTPRRVRPPALQKFLNRSERLHL